MKVRIEIDTKTFVRFWLVVIGFGLAGWMLYSAREALMLIGTALFLALALSYPVKKLAGILPGKSRLGGTALAFLSMIIILGGVVWFVVPPLVQQTAKFAETLPGLVDQANNQWHGLGEFIDQNGLRPQLDSMLDNVKRQASGWAANVGSGIISSVGSIFSFLASAFLVLAMAFLMLVEGPAWLEQLWGLYKNQDKRRHHQELIDKTYGVVTGYINGQLTVSGIGALVAGAFVFGTSLFVSTVEANLAMPTILFTFVLSLIPMFGATLAGVLTTVIIMFSNIGAGIAYAIFFTIYQQIENNFVSPAIQSKKVELSALVVLVAVTIGLYVGGLVGGVIAIPIAGTMKVFLDDHLERQRQRETAEHVTPLKKLAKKLTGKA